MMRTLEDGGVIGEAVLGGEAVLEAEFGCLKGPEILLLE